MAEIFTDKCVVRIKLLGRSIQAVAVFGNGQADNPNRRSVDSIQQGRAGLTREYHTGERADDSDGLVRRTALHQGV